jgi:hypothetical protein
MITNIEAKNLNELSASPMPPAELIEVSSPLIA